MDELISEISAKSNILCKDKHVLCLTDTTEYNYNSLQHKLKEYELGRISNNKSLGIFAHPVLIVDAEDLMPLGFADINLWTRDPNLPTKHVRKIDQQPIKKKESYKWITSLKNTNKTITTAKTKTLIADREGDLYHLFNESLGGKTEIISRARHDRRLLDEEDSLYQYLEKKSPSGVINLQVKGNTQIGRSSHSAKLEVKYGKVNIKRPGELPRSLPSNISLTVVEVKEKHETVKSGEPPLHWRLLTTHKVDTLKDALKIVDWYTTRWQIEELFAVTKSRGQNVENSQLETAEGLFKILALTFTASLRILQLTKGRNNQNHKASIVFNQQEITLLSTILRQYEGKTNKQKNNHPKYSLPWAAWIIGRMGGWKGYSSEAPPGTRTMTRGLYKLQNMMELWSIRDVCID